VVYSSSVSIAHNNWEALALQLKTKGMRPIIEQSWTRSSQARIRRDERRLFRRLDEDQTAARIDHNAYLVQVAAPHLVALSNSLEPANNVAYLTDAEGIVLFSAGYEIWRAVQGLMPGYDWSEKAMGTNGAGTALASKQPVAVIGPDHYLDDFSEASCFGSPIFGPSQLVVGAIDLSLSVSDSQPNHLELVVATADAIQKELLPT